MTTPKLALITAILLTAACAKRAPEAKKTGNPILDNPAYGTMEQRKELARDWGPVDDPVPPAPQYFEKGKK